VRTLVEDKLEAIRSLCREYDVAELSVFGSVLRDDFHSESDVDFLVAFRNADYGPFLSRLTDFEQALSAILAHPVDVATRESVESSENYIRKSHILERMRIIICCWSVLYVYTFLYAPILF